jgi:hypothetical protein
MGIATEQIANDSSICERKFWCFVILCAVAAAKRKVPNALEYFESEQFFLVCSFLDLNPDWIRKQALSDTPLGEEINQIYLMDYESLRLMDNPNYLIEKRARAKSRRAKSMLEESKGHWISGPGVNLGATEVIVESGVQCS